MANDQTHKALTALMADEAAAPVFVDEATDAIMYVGFALPTTTGEADPTWRIKRILTTKAGLKRIEFPEGNRAYRWQWGERAKYTYRPTPMWQGPVATSEEG